MESNAGGTSPIRVILIEGAILALKLLLNYIDFILVVAKKVYVAALGSTSRSSTNKPRVVIVGASFGGLAVEHALSKYAPKELQVTVIDYKDYFEYVPGALRCFIEPSHFKEGLSCPLSILQDVNGTNVITGQVVGVEATATNSATNTINNHVAVLNQVLLKDGRKVPYDYLILAAGSTYASPIKATPAQPTVMQRQEQWNTSAHELREAKTVLILGAGAVGVELAAEILTKYYGVTKKRVILVDTSNQILPGFNPSSVRYATEWLLRHGAELKLGSPLKRLEGQSNDAVWIDGVAVKIDLFYKCVGVAPNSDFLKNSTKTSLLTASLAGPRGAVVVNNHLQVKGLNHVFCVGDLCFHEPSNELKLGHTAEVNGHLATENVLRSIRGNSNKPLLTYPMGVVGNSVTPKIYDLSLGKYDATLGFNESLVIHGGLAAVVKWLLEWTKVAAAQQRPIGILFWVIADFVSNLLGRTLLPSTSREAASTATAISGTTRNKRQ